MSARGLHERALHKIPVQPMRFIRCLQRRPHPRSPQGIAGYTPRCKPSVGFCFSWFLSFKDRNNCASQPRLQNRALLLHRQGQKGSDICPLLPRHFWPLPQHDGCQRMAPEFAEIRSLWSRCLAISRSVL